MMDIYKSRKNRPPHWFVSNAIYIVTGSILNKQPLLDSEGKRQHFCETLSARAKSLGWALDAWSVMTNHYHFVAGSPENALTLEVLIQGLHSITAKFINVEDGTPGRKVWYNYWDTCIRTEASYYARLQYVMMNPVKHGLVQNPEDYPFSSYRYFLENSEPEFRKEVLVCSEDAQVLDDF
jgi:putative transposase